MDPDGSTFSLLLLYIVFVAIYAFFSLSEVAIVTLNDSKLKKLVNENNKKAIIINDLVSQPTHFLENIQVIFTLCTFFISAFTANRLGSLFDKYFSPYNVNENITLILSVLILVFVTLIFGYFLPKKIAINYCEPIAFFVAPAIKACFVIFSPFMILISAVTKIFTFILRINSDVYAEYVTEEEIRMMVDEGSEKGTIEQSEKDMIENIFEFDDNDVAKVMTHRTELVAINKDATVIEAARIAVEEGYSRIPVYNEDIDDIEGILYVKDLLSLVCECKSSDIKIEKYIRPVIFVPESKRCDDLFKYFKLHKIQIAIVVDEYGGTAGVVSMEDLLEAIVGNIQDEYDDEEEEYIKVSNSTYIFDGSIDIDDVEKIFDTEFDKSDDCDTLGGFITDVLERIPQSNEHPSIEIDGIKFTVLNVSDRRIIKVKGEIIKETEQKKDDID